jgi:signal peptidase I
MNSKKLKKWVSNFITGLLFVVLIFMIVVVVSTKASGGEPQIMGYQLKTVLSGSMEPGIKTGSIIAVKPGGDMNRFKKDDVITFKQEESILVTHRIKDVIKNGELVQYKTKGDNNKTEDQNLVLSDNVVAEYNGFTVPYIGYLMNFTNTKNGAFLFIIPGILLVLYASLSVWKALSEIGISQKKDESVDKIPPNSSI